MFIIKETLTLFAVLFNLSYVGCGLSQVPQHQQLLLKELFGFKYANRMSVTSSHFKALSTKLPQAEIKLREIMYLQNVPDDAALCALVRDLLDDRKLKPDLVHLLVKRARSMVKMIEIAKTGGRYNKINKLESILNCFIETQAHTMRDIISEINVSNSDEVRAGLEKILEDFKVNRDENIVIQSIEKIAPKINKRAKYFLDFFMIDLNDYDKLLHLLGTTEILPGITILQADELITQIARYFGYKV